MDTDKWYGVRTIYEHEDRARGRDRLYEERIVLIQADSPEEALAKAENEAKSYVALLPQTRYLGFASAFKMYEVPGEGIEVFSLMRDSRLEPKRYIDRFFDTGRERAS